MGKTLYKIEKRNLDMPGVDIFGTFYPFLAGEAAKGEIVAGSRLKQLSLQVASLNLSHLEDLTRKEAEEATGILNEFVEIILPGLPLDVLAELLDMEKLSIAEVYIKTVAPLPAGGGS
jgi:hypothetical protein